MRTILLARHGATPWTAEGRYQGQASVPLSDRGREAVRALARRLSACATARVDTVVTSDLARAVESARILVEGTGLEPALDPRLRERDCGRWTGLTAAEVRARFPVDVAALEAGGDVARGGGESFADVRARTLAWLADLVGSGPGTSLVVTHDGPIRALLGALDGGGRVEGPTQPLASVRVVRLDGSGAAASIGEPVWGEDGAEPDTWVPPL
jgi:probable phosphoglycerate mutase